MNTNGDTVKQGLNGTRQIKNEKQLHSNPKQKKHNADLNNAPQY